MCFDWISLAWCNWNKQEHPPTVHMGDEQTRVLSRSWHEYVTCRISLWSCLPHAAAGATGFSSPGCLPTRRHNFSQRSAPNLQVWTRGFPALNQSSRSSIKIILFSIIQLAVKELAETCCFCKCGDATKTATRKAWKATLHRPSPYCTTM